MTSHMKGINKKGTTMTNEMCKASCQYNKKIISPHEFSFKLVIYYFMY